MVYLALSVLFSSLIFVVFKLFTRFQVQTLYAIIVNYVTACSVGLIFYQQPIKPAEIPEKNWFLGSLALGLLFILIFNLMAATSQKLGVSVASVATKMSLVIPVLFGIILYQETLTLLESIGIVLALLAVYLASVKEHKVKVVTWAFLLPLSVFIGSGVIDTSINYFQESDMQASEYPLFSATIFASAAVIGFIFVLIKARSQPLRFNFKNVLGGMALGIPNYFSIYFLLKALQHPTLTSASVFTINNVAIVMFSTLLGILLFKEKLSTKNWCGIGLAIISIVLVALGDSIMILSDL
ncbi:MAG: EamA family transporter [Maribacter sp.]